MAELHTLTQGAAPAPVAGDTHSRPSPDAAALDEGAHAWGSGEESGVGEGGDTGVLGRGESRATGDGARRRVLALSAQISSLLDCIREVVVT